MEVDQISSELRDGDHGEPWHGLSRAAILADITAKEASLRPPGGVHSIWELVLHMDAWTQEVTRRLGGAAPELPQQGDWPAIPEPTDAEWQSARHGLDETHAALITAMKAAPDMDLDAMVGATHDAPLGTGISVRATLHGLAQHDAYHCGQIAILKRILRA